MTKHANRLPHQSDAMFLTDGGIETVLIFDEGLDLPHFAAIALLDDEHGSRTLRSYYRRYARLAIEARMGFVLESPTWRGSRDWTDRLGYSEAKYVNLNRKAIELMHEVRNELANRQSPMVISGNIGPRGDGYTPGELMSVGEARSYHSEQVRIFADSAADMVTGLTINYVNEAIGIVLAASDFDMPSVISFTTETDGRLPDGTGLADAISAVDEATGEAPAYFAINCAHVEHFREQLEPGSQWTRRIRAVRNRDASARSAASRNSVSPRAIMNA